MVQHGTLLRAGDALNALGYFASCIFRAPCCEKIEPPWRNSVSNSPSPFSWRTGIWVVLGRPQVAVGIFGVTRDWLEARLRTKLWTED